MDAKPNQANPAESQETTQSPKINNTVKKDKNPEKKPTYKQWWFWVIIVLGLLIIGGIGSANMPKSENSDKKDETHKEENTENNTQSSDGGETSKETEGTPSSENSGGYKVGETIVFKDSKITITNVTRNFSTGNMFAVPESGKEFVKVDLAIVNTTTAKKSFSAYDWKIQDGDGVIKDINFAATSIIDGGFTSSVDLAGGGKWSGSMVFEVPAGDTNLQLQYKPSLFSSTTVINI